MHALICGRAGVLWVLEQACGECIVLSGLDGADCAGNKSCYGVYDDHGSKFTAAEDIIADADFTGCKMSTHALVHALIAAANHNQVAVGCQLLHERLLEGAALWSEHDYGGGIVEDGIRFKFADGIENRFRFHDHAVSAAEWVVIHGAALVMGMAANVVDINTDEVILDGAPNDAFRHRTVEHVGENGKHMKTHNFSEDAYLSG